jgi:hypothetical protein
VTGGNLKSALRRITGERVTEWLFQVPEPAAMILAMVLWLEKISDYYRYAVISVLGECDLKVKIDKRWFELEQCNCSYPTRPRSLL